MSHRKIEFTKKFEKQLIKLKATQREAFYSRLSLFKKSPDAIILRNHPLKGEYSGYYSINVSGDLRALYKIKGESIVIFALIGTHSQLYG